MPCLRHLGTAIDTRPVVPMLAGSKTCRLRAASRAPSQTHQSRGTRKTTGIRRSGAGENPRLSAARSSQSLSETTRVGVRHVCANDAPRDFSLTRVTPRDTPRTDVGAELDEA